jgi:uncharacterized membrane protein
MDNGIKFILIIIILPFTSCNVVKDIFKQKEKERIEETTITDRTGRTISSGQIITSRFHDLQLDRSTYLRFDSLVFITITERGDIQATGVGAQIIQTDRSLVTTSEESSIDSTTTTEKKESIQHQKISESESSATERNVRRSATVPWIIVLIAFVAAVYVIASKFSPKILSKWR